MPGSASSRVLSPSNRGGSANSTGRQENSMSTLRELDDYIEQSYQHSKKLIERAKQEEKSIERTTLSKHQEQKDLDELKKQLNAKNDELKKMTDLYKKEIYEMQQNVDRSKRKLEDSEKQVERLQGERSRPSSRDSKDIQKRLEHKEKEIRDLKIELDDTKTRLSKIMGDQLTDNNPQIANLSDMNRPTKLGERYKQLYDNQWTDAYEILENKGKSENDIILILLKILMKTSRYCEQETQRQMEEVYKMMTQSEKVRKLGIPATVNKYLKDCRKASSSEVMVKQYKEYERMLQRSDSSYYANYVKMYTKECFEICWLMAIQDPPVVLAKEPTQGDTFKSDLYAAYTVTGQTVDFLVWPAMLLHAGGPTLTKGVVQCIKRPETAPARIDETKSYSHGSKLSKPKEAWGASSGRNRKTAAEDLLETRSLDYKRDTTTADYDDAYNGRYGRNDKNDLYGYIGGGYKEMDLRNERKADLYHERDYDQQRMSTRVTGSATVRYTHRQYEESYVPSQASVDKYLYYKKRFDDKTVEYLMGSEYGNIDNYFRRA